MSAQAPQPLVSWVETTFSMGEAFAVGGMLGNGTVFRHGATADYASCMDEPVWKAIGDAVKMAHERCGTDRLRCVFSGGTLWTAARGDGAWLGVFVPRELAAPERDQLTARLDQFLTLA